DCGVVDGGDQIAGLEADLFGRSARDDGTNRRARGALGRRGTVDLDAQEAGRADRDGVGGAAAVDLLDDGEGGVDRDGVGWGTGGSAPGGRAGRVHADDPATGVVKRATGLAGLQGGVDLDEAGQFLGVAPIGV